MSRHRYLHEHAIRRMGQVQTKRLGQYRLTTGFNVLQKGRNELPVETEPAPRQHIPVLGKDTLVETDGGSAGQD